MSETVKQEILGSVSTITLNRPDSLNAIDHSLASDLRSEVLSAEMNKSVRCVVLKGAGPAFMAGGDIRAFSERLNDGVDRYMLDLTHDLHDAIIAIRRMRKPVLASVHGAAAGAGFSLAMACDMVLAADNSTFTLAYSMLGVSPDGSSTHSLPRLVGYHRAMELVLLSERFGVEKAKEMGLINIITPADQLDTQTVALAERLAAGPTAAYGRAKVLLNKSLERGISDQLDAEAQGIMESSRTEDFKEGVDAFLNKRKPQFTGK
jgi:2-(1,2-epoxy-1,2-dihydrophenyl)acetyl-CoA isomerase